jgi:hypothetical protein
MINLINLYILQYFCDVDAIKSEAQSPAFNATNSCLLAGTVEPNHSCFRCCLFALGFAETHHHSGIFLTTAYAAPTLRLDQVLHFTFESTPLSSHPGNTGPHRPDRLFWL